MTVADDSAFPAQRVYAASIRLATTEQEYTKLELPTALVSQHARHNLLSIPRLAAAGWDLSLRDNILIDQHGKKYTLHPYEGLYYVQIVTNDTTRTVSTTPPARNFVARQIEM